MSETMIQSDLYIYYVGSLQQNLLCQFDCARFMTLLKGFISDVTNSINFLKNELSKLQIKYGLQLTNLIRSTTK